MKVELGKDMPYPKTYDPGLLEAIPRTFSRASIGVKEHLPFTGTDLWTAYELSWLNKKGVPQVAIADFVFDATSENIIESKSFKYYLNSLNQTRVESREYLVSELKQKLSYVSKADVDVTLTSVDQMQSGVAMPGTCVDLCDVSDPVFIPDVALLKQGGRYVQKHQLYSHLLKSNCPMTGQPDWATIWIEYSGREILAESFLAYVVSFRDHQDFHENCVEKIFVDIEAHCQPDELTVYARYTRRGGLDINPMRTNCDREVPFFRLSRQ